MRIKRNLAAPQLLAKVCGYLTSAGPSSAKTLCAQLHMSQPSLSRLVTSNTGVILRIERGPSTRYACHRMGAWGDPRIPLFIIDEHGNHTKVAIIHPIAPQGIYIESTTDFLQSALYPNLPYLFEDLRPAGFLGRLVPGLHPDLDFPKDITHWTDNDCLVYLTRCGWDLIGSYLLGERSYNLFLEQSANRLDCVKISERSRRYPTIAELVLDTGIPGSSAAGEQPKFLAIRTSANTRCPVLVKFSPPIADALSQRIVDLLVCEHIAHRSVAAHGQPAPASSLVRGDARLFLEVERFDRTRSGGRRGVISLHALDLQFVGQHRSWSETAASLRHQNILDENTYQAIMWFEVFGKLIGNTDRHHGNISLWCHGETIIGLAPIYDMLPMLYAPQQHQLVERAFAPKPPTQAEHFVWRNALAAAIDFWMQVQKHPDISIAFKKISADNAAILTALAKDVDGDTFG